MNAKVGETPGVVLAVLLAAGAALSSLFTDDSSFVLHGAEIESSGHGAPDRRADRPDPGLLGRRARDRDRGRRCCRSR